MGKCGGVKFGWVVGLIGGGVIEVWEFSRGEYLVLIEYGKSWCGE